MSGSTSSTITTYYQRILFRDPTASELAGWNAQVGSGAVTLEHVRGSLLAHPEAASFVDPVIRLYQAAFGRVPESSGAIDHYADRLRDGRLSLTTISENFANSPEFALRYGSAGPNTPYITALYVNVLGRVPSTDEINWYLKSGMSTAQMLQGFSQSPEFQARSAAAVDALLNANALGTAVFSGPLPIVTADQPFTLTTDTPSVTEGDAGSKVLTFALTLDRAPTEAITVNYQTLSTGSATPRAEFDVAADTVTFEAGQRTATVTVNVLGDHAAEADETVQVQFSGTRLVSSVTATGTIANDDAAPAFTSPAAVSVAEGSTAVMTVAAPDADGDAVSLAIAGGADAARFALNGGALSFASAPNFEAPVDSGANNVYNLTIRATDVHGNVTDQAIAVTVTDVNEAPTALALTGQLASIAENTAVPARLKVADIVVTDDALGTETFSLSGADAARFEIVGTELFLRSGIALNFEGQTGYNVTVSAADAALAGSVPVSANYALAVTNVNEAPVAVADGPFSVVTGNSITMNVLANDTDVDAGTTLRISGTPAVTNGSGTVAVNANNQLVYTAPNGFQGVATISYNITDGTNVVATTQNVSVGEPAIAAASTSVNEGQAIVFNIKGVAGTTYSVQLDSVGLNDVADGTRLVTTNASGDATLTLATTADRTTEGAQSLQANIVGTLASPVVVTVNDTSLNNVAPVTSNVAQTVAEGAAAITGRLTATDADAEDAGRLTFSTNSVVAGFSLNADGSYRFDPTNAAYDSLALGQTSVQTVAFTVNDNATNAGGGARTAAGTLTITVTGTNDTPVVTVANTTPTVNENTTAVTTFVTSDVDAGTTLSAVTLSGDDAALFQIVGGNLAFRTAPNFESPTDANRDGVYNVTLNVTDNVGATGSTAVRVTVADVADAVGPVTDADGALGGTVAENAVVGTAVGITALAVEPQAGDTVSYALTTNPGNLFAIDRVTGVVTVNGALDFETAANHSITVQATSSDGSTSNANFNIAVTDVAEARTFNLTSGADTGAAYTGANGNDIFNAIEITNAAGNVVNTWTTGDALDGGLGNDTLNIIQTAAITNPLAATVTGIETINATTNANAVLNTTAFAGLTALNVTAAGNDGALAPAAAATTITAAATTAVTVTSTGFDIAGNSAVTVDGGANVTVTATKNAGDTITVGGITAAAGDIVITSTTAGGPGGAIAATGDGTITINQTTGALAIGGNITTNGGTVINVAQAGASAGGPVTVNGGVATTTVTASMTGVGAAPVVKVTDLNAGTADADSITTVTLTNYDISTIDSGALATLNLSGAGGTLVVNANVAGVNQTATTLALNLNGLTGVANGVTLGSSAGASSYTTVNLNSATAASNLAALAKGGGAAQVATLNISGDAALTLGAQTALTAAAAIVSTNTAGVTLNTALTQTQSFTGGNGDDVISIAGAHNANVSMGAGNDQVTIGGATIAAGRTIDGGAGTADLLVMSAADAQTATASAAAEAAFADRLTGFERLALTGATNQTIDLARLDMISHVTEAGDGNTLTINNMTNGGTFVFTDKSTLTAINLRDAGAGTADVMNLTVTGLIPVAIGGVTVNSVETINIESNDTLDNNGLMVAHTGTLTADAVKTIVLTGDAGFTLTYTGTTATKIDASGLTVDAADATPAGFTWTSGALASAATIVSANGDDQIIASLATKAVTITTNGGKDQVTVLNANNNVINTGDGDDQITVGTGGNTISAGAGNDVITLGAITAVNNIDVGTGNDTVVFGAVQATSGAWASITGMGVGDILNFGLINGAPTPATLGAATALGGASTFTDYLNAAAAIDGSANSNFEWFQFGGNTYVVHDRGAGAGFTNGTDQVVELIGLINLSASTQAAGLITIV